MNDINSIAAARKIIDELDVKLLEHLNERMEVVKRIGELKRSNAGSIYRPDREQAIIKRLTELSTGKLNRKAIEAIFLEIFAISRNLELAEKVAYLGPEGSFTHQAAESRFGAISEYIPLKTIKNVFESVATARVRFGVVPIENNQEGIVADTIKLLSSLEINIAAELPMPIHFTFASTTENVKDISIVYSKDIAFKQCSDFIDNYLGENVELIPVDSTSKAAHIASIEEGTAAVCSPIAAKLNKLPMLFDNIENSADNFTRFLIISNDFMNEQSGNDKTTILVKLSAEAGSLVNFLQRFYNNGINLTKIESYPAKKGKGFSYQFLLEFDGHFEDQNVSSLLKDDSVQLLGSYPKLC